MMDKVNDFPVIITEKGKCCGCLACAAICSKQAISVEIDSEGFWYPKINYNKCVACKRCISVCDWK